MTQQESSSLRRYVELLEAAREERGLGGRVLPPADWRRLERWFQAGIPVGWVIEYLDLARKQRNFSGKNPWRSIERHLWEAWQVICGYPTN